MEHSVETLIRDETADDVHVPLRAPADRITREPVLVVTRHYAPEPTGSAPVMQQLAEWLADDGRAVRVLTVRPSYPEPRMTPGYAAGERDRAIEGGVAVRRLPTAVPRGGGLLARIVPEIRFFLDLAWQSASGRTAKSPTVVSLCPSIFTVLGACLLVRRGGRHVAVVHDIASGLGIALGMRSGSWAARLLRRLEAFALNRADEVVTQAGSGAAHRARGRPQAPRTGHPHDHPRTGCKGVCDQGRRAGAGSLQRRVSPPREREPALRGDGRG